MAINDVKTGFVAHVEDEIDYTPGSAVAAGDIVVQEKLIGVATRPIAANTLGSIKIRGIFEFPCGSEDIATVGTPVYLASGLATATSGGAGGNPYLGKTVAASSGTGSLKTVKVLLEPSYTLMA